jgi:hypothetical protein
LVKEFKIIKISPETHKELEDLGTKRDSFDSIIQRIMKFYKENKK